MAGPVVTSDSVAGISTNGIIMGRGGGGGLQNNGINSSELNSFRVSAVIERLSDHVQGQRKSEIKEFFSLCLSLARGIDFAVANHELPSRSNELPSLLKLVCQNRNDVPQQAAIMVLMISVKSACQNEWFSSKDTEELMNLAKEIGSIFCDASNTEPSCSLSVIPTIFSRFFPKMRMGHVFASLVVEPGFDAYVADFQIPKDLKISPGDKIRLFVAQTDNIETSSCLITPAKVNFLLNGKPVERRTSLVMDPGPQIPTIVSQFLKYGSNLLQAVGEFNGNYIVAVALMTELPSIDCSDLKDYEQLADVATMDSDSEVILGPSRISLNCSISFKRINTPVKGHSCNHIQCFDFNNYMDINLRRPSWRCPHCNQHVCFSDLRIDRKMVKILEEVGTGVSDIIISLDGSWKPVTESSNTKDKPEDESLSTGQDESLQPADILDLTKTDDVIDSGTEDLKHVPNADQRQFMGMNTGNNPYTSANTSDIGSQIRHVFSSGPTLPTFGLSGRSSNVVPNAQMVGTSFLTDPFTSPNIQVEAFNSNVLVANTGQQSEISLPTTSQLQQHQFGNPSISHELGRFPAMARNVSRTMASVQTPTSVLQQSFRSSVNSFGPNAASPQASPAVQNIPTAAPSPVLQHHRTQQNTFPQHQQSSSFQNPNQASNLSYRVSNEQHSSSQQMGNLTTHRSMSPSAGLNQSSIRSQGFPSSRNHMNISADRSIHSTSSQQAHLIASANRSVQMAIDPRLTASFLRNNSEGLNVDQSGNIGVASQPVQRTNAFDPVDTNWRPAGRMRGALSGQAYTNALNEYIIRPGQQAHIARPVSNVSSLTTNLPPQLQALMTGGVSQGTTPPNYPSAGQASRPG